MNNTAAVPDREPLAGLVERVTYHNPDNGYCVLRVKVRGHRDLVTVLGHAASISAGEFVQASGKWEVHREHGQQFRAAFLKSAPPSSLEGMEKYLGSGLIKGIGPVYAKKLVKAFGEAVFDVIEQQGERLIEVAGIGPKRASKIRLAWSDQKAIREIMVFLQMPRRRHLAGGSDLQDLRGRRDPAGDREPVPAGPRHPRHRLQDRRHDRGEARHSQDGDDPGQGRDLLCPAERGR